MTRAGSAAGRRAQPLWRLHPWRLDIPLLALAAAVALVWGVTLPALRFENLFADDVFSVLSGIQAFLASGNLLLALLLFVFSVAFPLVKVTGILVLWLVPLAEARRGELVRWLEFLGKWSMLDSFVIAVLIAAIQLGILTQALAEPGIHVYMAAILASLAATFLLSAMLRAGRRGAARLPALPLASLWVTVVGAFCYGVGLGLPLMSVEKLLWDNRFSLLGGTAALWQHGEHVLAVALLLFVIVVPSVRFVALAAMKVARLRGRAPHRWLALLDAWSMADVFVLALMVVVTKISGLAHAKLGPGMWLLLAAAALTLVDSWLVHRAQQRGR